MDTEAQRFAGRRCAILVLLLTALVAGNLAAIDTSTLKPHGYVSDFANVLDDSARLALERYCTDVEQSTGAQMAIVTVPTLEGEPVEDVANRLYREWGIGKKGKDEGVMLLLATRDRKSRVEVGYGLEPILPDGAVGSVLREMRPSLQGGDYGAALQAGASEIGTRIAEAKGVAIERTLPRRAPPQSGGGGRGIPFGLIAMVILFLLVGRGGRGGGLLTGMILGNLLGGGRNGGGGWGGGGFGGGDSGGGGWGGFGGGDSGGGGASGSW